LISSLIGQEQVLSIVEKYDQQSLFSMFLRYYHILHPMAAFGPMANMQTNEESTLNI
jgi:hypothetical protein